MEDAKRIRRIVREKDKNKDLSQVQNEMGRLMHHDEQELLIVWQGWHWDDNKGVWFDPEMCAQARREEGGKCEGVSSQALPSFVFYSLCVKPYAGDS